MYNIIEQTSDQKRSDGRTNMTTAMVTNGTKFATVNGVKFDCAKECPCGVPAIPVPDQWLEVMVTGGFKVWHIIFIIIALLVTIVVVYCCFHRCRIPRTKQEIEADLMRTNLSNKFRDYLQEFPNEPTTFIEALKRVRELEEKASDQDDLNAQKRRGWLKLKGKEKEKEKDKEKEKLDEIKSTENISADTTTAIQQAADTQTVVEPTSVASGEQLKNEISANNQTISSKTNKNKSNDLLPSSDVATIPKQDTTNIALDNNPKQVDISSEGTTTTAIVTKSGQKKGNKVLKSSKLGASRKEISTRDKDVEKRAKSEIKSDGHSETRANETQQQDVEVTNSKPQQEVSVDVVVASNREKSDDLTQRSTKVRRKREKPNLSRTKADHVRGESIDNSNSNQLNLPSVSSSHHHHHKSEQHKRQSDKSIQQQPLVQTNKTSTGEPHSILTKSSHQSHKTDKHVRTKVPKESTIIQIEPQPKETLHSTNKQTRAKTRH